MKCKKCGHNNGEYDVICEQCGTSLNFENYHDKGKHIDIEEIETPVDQPDFNKIRKQVSRIIVISFILVITFLFYFLGNYFLDKDSKKVLDMYKDYMTNSSLALFYLGEEEEVDLLCKEYSSKYGFDYLNLPLEKFSIKERKKIQKELNVYNISSTFVIVESGVPIISFSNTEMKENLLSFLQNNELVPEKIGDTEESLEAFKNAFSSENSVLLYFPTGYHEGIEESSEALSSIASTYDLDYYEVKGYLLSKKQLLKMMSQLGFSEIQGDLILSIENGNIIKIVEDKNHSDYFKLLSSYDIIDTSSADYLVNISVEKFQEFLSDGKDKYVILVGSKDCTYCDRVKSILGRIASQNHILIHYLDASSDWNFISTEIQNLGVETGLTSTPFLMILEKNKILDYVVGLATKELYVDKLTELGVIR